MLQPHHAIHTKLHYANYNYNHNHNYNHATLQCTTLDYTALRYPELHYARPIAPLQCDCNYTTLITLQLHYATTTTRAAAHHTTSSSCGWGDHCNHCNHSNKHNSNHLWVNQWIRSAIRDSQQPTSPIGFLFWNFRHRLVRYYWYDDMIWSAHIVIQHYIYILYDMIYHRVVSVRSRYAPIRPRRWDGFHLEVASPWRTRRASSTVVAARASYPTSKMPSWDTPETKLRRGNSTYFNLVLEGYTQCLLDDLGHESIHGTKGPKPKPLLNQIENPPRFKHQALRMCCHVTLRYQCWS